MEATELESGTESIVAGIYTQYETLGINDLGKPNQDKVELIT